MVNLAQKLGGRCKIAITFIAHGCRCRSARPSGKSLPGHYIKYAQITLCP